MPILFFGSRAVRTRVGEGTFVCPRCGVPRRYALMRAQRHAHLYWVPLLRIGAPQQYVECQHCRATYADGVQADAAAAGPDDDLRGALSTAALAAFATLRRGAAPSAGEARVIAQALHALEGVETAVERIAERVAGEASDAPRAARGLAHVAPALDVATREGLVTAFAHLAHADAAPDPRQAAALEAFAAALGITRTHLKGILVELDERHARTAAGAGTGAAG